MAGTIASMRHTVLTRVYAEHVPPGSLDELWDLPALEAVLATDFGLTLPLRAWNEAEPNLIEETIRERVLAAADAAYADKEALARPEFMRRFEKDVLLQVLDNHWKEHLAAMDYLRQGIHLRGFAQKNPKQEYKREAFEMFEAMLGRIQHDVASFLMRVQFQQEAPPLPEHHEPAESELHFEHAEISALAEGDEAAVLAAQAAQTDRSAHTPYVRDDRKVGRNDPCPCGSGKKFKMCHGREG